MQSRQEDDHQDHYGDELLSYLNGFFPLRASKVQPTYLNQNLPSESSQFSMPRFS